MIPTVRASALLFCLVFVSAVGCTRDSAKGEIMLRAAKTPQEELRAFAAIQSSSASYRVLFFHGKAEVKPASASADTIEIKWDDGRELHWTLIDPANLKTLLRDR